MIVLLFESSLFLLDENDENKLENPPEAAEDEEDEAANTCWATSKLLTEARMAVSAVCVTVLNVACAFRLAFSQSAVIRTVVCEEESSSSIGETAQPSSTVASSLLILHWRR